MAIKIEKDVPIPNKFYGMTKDLIEAFQKMQSGDSFLFPKRHVPAVRRAAHIYKKKFDPSAKFIVGESAAEPRKVRVWKRLKT